MVEDMTAIQGKVVEEIMMRFMVEMLKVLM